MSGFRAAYLPQRRPGSCYPLNEYELQQTRWECNTSISRLAIQNGTVQVAVWLSDNMGTPSGLECREKNNFIDISSADLAPNQRRSFIGLLFERRARPTHLSPLVTLVIDGRAGSTFYCHPAGREYSGLPLSDDYSTLVQILREDSARPSFVAEFSPYRRCFDLESGITWIREFREVHGNMDPAAIQRLLHLWEVPTIAQPVVFRDLNENFTIETSRLSARRPFMARPQTAQVGWNQKIEYYTPLSWLQFERPK